jgi:hypothetical protein
MQITIEVNATEEQLKRVCAFVENVQAKKVYLAKLDKDNGRIPTGIEQEQLEDVRCACEILNTVKTGLKHAK